MFVKKRMCPVLVKCIFKAESPLLQAQRECKRPMPRVDGRLQCGADSCSSKRNSARYVALRGIVSITNCPTAKYTINIRGFTVDETDMLCLALKVNFLPGFLTMWNGLSD